MRIEHGYGNPASQQYPGQRSERDVECAGAFGLDLDATFVGKQEKQPDAAENEPDIAEDGDVFEVHRGPCHTWHAKRRV